MAVGRVRNGWLYFKELDYGHPIDGAFAIGYRILDDQDELWSRRFLSLKDGTVDSRKAALAVMRVAMPVLLDTLGLDGEDVTFAPALRSHERTASTSGMISILAGYCAAHWSSAFSPGLLSKQPHESLHIPRKSVPERRAILEKADYRADNVTTAYVFVVDDLITTGLTLSYIAGAIKNQNPEVKVYGLAAGKHAYQSHFSSVGQPSANSHIRPEWNRLWYAHDNG